LLAALSRCDSGRALWVKGTHVLLHINAVKILLRRTAACDDREAGNSGISPAVLLAREAVKAAMPPAGQALQASALSVGAGECVTVVPRKRQKYNTDAKPDFRGKPLWNYERLFPGGSTDPEKDHISYATHQKYLKKALRGARQALQASALSVGAGECVTDAN